jgi:hypothetical protein
LLRHWHCPSECGWRGFRFSHSKFHERTKQIRSALVIALIAVLGAGAIWYALSRTSPGGHHDDGIQEGD